MASKGHVRDLPKSDLGVAVDSGFTPSYEVIPSSRKVVADLKKAAALAGSVYLATDFDREGEAIAWHVTQAIGMEPQQAERVTFTEITEQAIKEAFRHPRRIDMSLVNAQQARRVLDRLVGYKLSPLLWSKIRRNLSAGRVQSAALKLIVDREREIRSFVPREYWTIEARLLPTRLEGEAEGDDKSHPAGSFVASLLKHKGKKLEIADQRSAERHRSALSKASFVVQEVRTKDVKRNPPPPFTTSTLQQEASRKLGFSGQRTMAIAQQLYEGVEVGAEGRIGLITYMRTDSVHVAKEAQEAIREEVRRRFGPEYCVEKPRTYRTKSKGAQEAHEAIRPTYVSKDPESLKPYLSPEQYKLYKLIWQRAVATQMREARFRQSSVDVSASGGYLLRATGQVRLFDGYMRVYVEGSDDEQDQLAELPVLEPNEPLRLLDLTASQHFTQPPPRYTDASLIKTLEEHGIGRPSTYAPTISTLLERGYVVRENKKLVPLDAGIVVTEFLEEHFPHIVDVGFTSQMEEDLDEIASGKTDWVPVVRDFYDEFARILEKKEKEVSSHLETTEEVCERCGAPMVVRLGRYGRFLSCSKYPECKNARPLAKPESPEPVGESCPECGRDLVRRRSRFGEFIGCSGYPECRYVKRESQTTGARCPECGGGELVAKRTKRGRLFYGCNRYPECRFATWNRPLGDPCPSCGGTILAERSGARCSSCGAISALDHDVESADSQRDDEDRSVPGASRSRSNQGRPARLPKKAKGARGMT